MAYFKCTFIERKKKQYFFFVCTEINPMIVRLTRLQTRRIKYMKNGYINRAIRTQYCFQAVARHGLVRQNERTPPIIISTLKRTKKREITLFTDFQFSHSLVAHVVWCACAYCTLIFHLLFLHEGARNFIY